MGNFIGLVIPPDVQRKWEKAIRDLGEEARKEAVNVIKDTVMDLRTRIVQKTPVEKGRLQQSLQEPSAVEIKERDLEGRVFTNVEYAPRVEYQFCKRHGIKHLMFTRSMEEMRPKFLNRLEKAYRELMRK
ncbi:HK97 gp10 family phage protein [Kosmotoga pacifica]|uniref:HK97 gp10 family phage protein n=1 Tax=Kosmotoga pacifica TaxID=1330330 RepID=A0A0G2Z4V3_9BACT|nr:HK97 gp10 family phage protein [Kosmotoga pacifica]AKI96582.1 hypothetical protein IX53_00710 [Kosmotoga pacifica]